GVGPGPEPARPAGLRARPARPRPVGAAARWRRDSRKCAAVRGGRLNLRDATPGELEDWDACTVDAPGGHVYQSRAWAAHREASGWRPRFLVDDAGERALALTRSWPLVGGGSAYVPRGPGPVDTDAAALAARLIAVADHLAADGIDVVAADPEVPDTET